ncbi:conserved hypothetical protein [Rubrivivax sp. A210]|uniref:glutaredoxin family protein n=1 Tax=Rubrivivax sp. A210 TaxID=2772301 RepID=UPI00191ABC2C|nr:glutaredoxin family protein [Rubrivivax sp. A210]CAD5371713.1 conserved hypothetical protein [Rubrivivax sp. A210]
MKTTPREWLVLALLVLAVGGASQWWAGHRRNATAVELAALARPGDIRMLASETCGICVLARRWFAEHGIPFSECVIERDPACRAQFEASRAPGTPLMLVRGSVVVGFDPQRLLAVLQQPPRFSLKSGFDLPK